MNTIKYVSEETIKLYESATSSGSLIELLWGDRVEILEEESEFGRFKVRSRGVYGYVDEDEIGDEPLLELYFIDVGQGDGVLIKTPKGKHILIDGGYKRSKQPSGKNAADFVDWKFYKDYRMDKIVLDAMIASHCDADHYGGLWDLLNLGEQDELDVEEVEVGHFYHAGVGWFKDESRRRFLGPEEDGYLLKLLGDEQDIKNYLPPKEGLRLQGEWADFLQAVIDAELPVSRLSHRAGETIQYLPGFGPEQGDAVVKVLSPVEFLHEGAPVYQDLGSYSTNTNGHSISLRIDYGRARILLTGDLNAKSQRLLLDNFLGQRQEFACDVTKACHHGSEDVSYEFLNLLKPSATVISSGDTETHAHPRPAILAASAITGNVQIEKDKIITPLIYSTEIARSLKLGDPYEMEYQNEVYDDEQQIQVRYRETKSGALNPKKKEKKLSNLYVVGGIVYGLVNVRTDGNKIMCATLNEGKYKWEYEVFYSRF